MKMNCNQTRWHMPGNDGTHARDLKSSINILLADSLWTQLPHIFFLSHIFCISDGSDHVALPFQTPSDTSPRGQGRYVVARSCVSLLFLSSPSKFCIRSF
eukprot:766419_1